MRWLMPRLSDFHMASGEDVRLSTAGGPVKLGVLGLSLAIRRDDFELPHDYKQVKLVDEWVGPVFSPEYWDQVKNDLSKVKLLHSQTRPQAWNVGILTMWVRRFLVILIILLLIFIFVFKLSSMG